ncbi:kinase-like domain-containing protein [Polychytrium aggregatum]|uniref:kinase-like domain-containing protein n=1 Tax=Polychytrium aggregatum TaxID=110093 RepID=UPI0022FE4B2D|nr:kinase-like domain-containing protein [Polychytrium aggregatum]KAI9203614.1 kinase-like domain-containing protein [Polychytrium aggregatum]
MVSPFMPNGTLRSFVSDPDNVRPLDDKLRLLLQVAAGMAYLHDKRIVHGDLKTQNVLIDPAFNAVVSDFGMARVKHTAATANRTRAANQHSAGGTLDYMAPEMLDDDNPSDSTKQTDVYAFGITMYEVLNDGRTIWVTGNGQPMRDVVVMRQLFLGNRPKRPGNISDALWDVVEQCWHQDPSLRPSFPEIAVLLEALIDPMPSNSGNGVGCMAASTPAESEHPITHDDNGPSLATLDNLGIPDPTLVLAKQGDPIACLQAARLVRGELGETGDDDRLAAQLLKASADGGNLEATLEVGWLYLTGHHVEQNDGTAFAFWQKALDHSTDPAHRTLAAYMLGWLHYLGRGTGQDKQMGVHLMEHSKSDGFGLGELESLASWPLTGYEYASTRLSSTTSHSAAAHQLLRNCEVGSKQDWLCKHILAICYVFGFGTNRSQKRAVKIFEELAKTGHSDSRVWAGRCYYEGWGVSKNQRKAFLSWTAAAEQGNASAMFLVGSCLHWGLGTERDYGQALEWYRRSAEQGCRLGQHELDQLE